MQFRNLWLVEEVHVFILQSSKTEYLTIFGVQYLMVTFQCVMIKHLLTAAFQTI